MIFKEDVMNRYVDSFELRYKKYLTSIRHDEKDTKTTKDGFKIE